MHLVHIKQGWLQIPTQAQLWDDTVTAAAKSKIPGVELREHETSQRTNILMQLLTRNISNNYSKQPVFTGGICWISWQLNGKTLFL